MTVITPDLAARIKVQLGKDIELSIKRANESIADAEKAKTKLALLDSPAYLAALGELDEVDNEVASLTGKKKAIEGRLQTLYAKRAEITDRSKVFLRAVMKATGDGEATPTQ